MVKQFMWSNGWKDRVKTAKNKDRLGQSFRFPDENIFFDLFCPFTADL